MINKTEWNRMMEGKLYNPYKVGDNSFENVHEAQKKFNESEYWNDKSAFEELKKCFKVAPVDMVLTPPVYFDHGDRISFGKHFYANTGLTGTWHMISEEPHRILRSLQTNLLVQQARQIQCQNAVHKSKQPTGGSPGLPYLQ